jgi:hypothetical protein
MLAERAAMEADGRWAAEKISLGDLQPRNEETSVWMKAATADFYRCLFLVKGAEQIEETPENAKKWLDSSQLPLKPISVDAGFIDFKRFVFPGDVSFVAAIIEGTATFESATFSGDARFRGTTFKRTAFFESTTFKGIASFTNATFIGQARFSNSTFAGNSSFGGAAFTDFALFESATFTGNALFDVAAFRSLATFNLTTFTGTVMFDRTTFATGATFYRATFTGDASFNSVTFTGGTTFRNATFFSTTSFEKAMFRFSADFIAIKVAWAFNFTGARFQHVPAFNQANFTEGPDLDDVRMPLPWVLWRGKREQIAKYRALKRMAIKGADYEREQMFAKAELRSRRFTEDHIFSLGLWIGLLYDLVADCGRSIFRPFAVWATAIYGFAWLYQSRAVQAAAKACVASGGEPFTQALFLSGKNALVVFGGIRDARVNQAYTCLYGGTPDQPAIPSAVTFTEAFAQTPVSTALIFLFLLAVRNRFKIK